MFGWLRSKKNKEVETCEEIGSLKFDVAVLKSEIKCAKEQIEVLKKISRLRDHRVVYRSDWNSYPQGENSPESLRKQGYELYHKSEGTGTEYWVKREEEKPT